MSQPIPPYIAMPTSRSDHDIRSVADCFAQRADLSIYRGDPRPPARLAGTEVEALREFTAWLLEFGPELARQVTFWALATYAGKKFIDGAAEEAGKDFWQGVKRLGRLICQRLSQGKKADERTWPVLNILASGETNDHSLYYDTIINFSLPPDTDRLKKREDQVERFLLCLVACIATKMPRVVLRIHQEEGGLWTLANLETHEHYWVDLDRQRFSRFDIHVISTSDETRVCLEMLGLEGTEKLF